MSTKALRKVSLFIAVIVALTGLLAGCAGGSDSKEKGNPAAESPKPAETQKPAEPIELNVLLPYYGDMPDKNGPIFKKVEEIMNAKLNAEFALGPNFKDKVNVTLASGNLPDILTVTAFTGQPSIITAMQAGAFWELDSYLPKFPNLMAAKDPVRDNIVKVNGKTYVVYVSAPIQRGGFDLRKDWMDNLGLQQPKTVDEYYEVLKAFTKNDPDKNGKDDTVGIATFLAGKLPEGFDIVLSKFGAPNDFKVENGKFIPDFATAEYRNAMKFFKKLYDEGLMNKDFAYAKKNQVNEMIQSGKAGGTIGNVDDLPRWEKVFKSNPNASLMSIGYLEGPTGNHTFSRDGFFYTHMFPKSTVKTEERLLEILAALDRMSAPDLDELRLYGVEGVHYKKEDGKRAPLQELSAQDGIFMSQFSSAIYPVDTETMPPWRAAMQKVVQENEDQNALVTNPSAGLISPTYVEVGTELDTLIGDSVVKYILGDLDDNGFDKVIEKWKSTGGDKVLAEYEEQYNKK